MDAPEIDLSKIKGRSSARAQETQDAWAEAQRMFKERVKRNEKIPVDIG